MQVLKKINLQSSLTFNSSSDMEPLLSTEDMLGNMGQEIEHLLSKVNTADPFRLYSVIILM